MREVAVRVLGAEPFVGNITLPSSLSGYRELWDRIELEKRVSFESWRALMRLWSAGDLFFFGMYVSMRGLGNMRAATGMPWFWHPLQLQYARWIQFDSDEVIDIAAREFGKSSWKTFMRNLWSKLSDPDLASCIYSHTGEYADKHLNTIQTELRENELLKTVWSDRFYWDPDHRDAGTFSLKDGLCIKRATTRPEQTFEARTFIHSLPTGTHFDESFFDDIEEDKAISTAESIQNVINKFIKAQDLTSKAKGKPFVSVTGTYHHPAGPMRRLETELGYRARVLPGEDLSRPEPDPTKAGPLGGRCNFFTPTELRDVLRRKGGIRSQIAVRDYTRQICCNPIKGERTVLRSELIQWYTERPNEIARMSGMNGVLCVDTSRGRVDPSFAWLWGLTKDRRLYWLDGFREFLAPAAREARVLELVQKWEKVIDIVQLRMENFGQSEVVERQRTYNDQWGCAVPIIPCRSNEAKSGQSGFEGREAGKREREYARWEPALARGEVLFPRQGIFFLDDQGDAHDLVKHFVENELEMFPTPLSDDGLDAGALIWEPVDKAGPLPWPEGRRERYRRGLARSRDDNKDGTFMSAGGL